MRCYYFIYLAAIRSFARLSETLSLSFSLLEIARTRVERERRARVKEKIRSVSASRLTKFNKSCLARTNGKEYTDRTADYRPNYAWQKTQDRGRGRIFFPCLACPPTEENKGSARVENQRVQLKVTIR